MPNRSVNTTKSPRHSSPNDNSQSAGRKLFAVASLMARNGNYTEASQLLRQAQEANECSDTDALDLQARIFAQQGMLVRAEACWIEALSQDPGNKTYVEAIARLQRTHDPLRRSRSMLLIIVVIAFVATGLWFATTGYQNVLHRQEDMGSKLEQLESTLNDLRTSHDDAQRANKSSLDGLGTDVRQSQIDSTAAIANLATTSHVDAQFRQLLSANQAAMNQIAEDARHLDGLITAQRKEDRSAIVDALKGNSDALSKQVDGHLVKIQTEIVTAMKVNHDQQVNSTKALVDQIEQNAKAIAILQSDTATSITALEKRVQLSMSVIQQELASVRVTIDRILWFRLPAQNHEPPIQDGGSNGPTTKPAPIGRTIR